MKAFIAAAGFGERLRPLTELTAKPLVPVLNVPAIAYALALVFEAGIDQIAVNAHWHHEQLTDFFAHHDHFGRRFAFSIEAVLQGTGGGLMGCRPFLQDDRFVMLNGDMILDVDLRRVIAAHERSGRRGLLVVRPVPEAGRVTVDGGLVVDMRGLAGHPLTARHDYTGVAVMDPEIFSHLVAAPSDIVVTGFMALVARGELAAWEYDGPVHDIGTIVSYRAANEAMRSDGTLAKRVAAATGLRAAAIADDALIDASAIVERSVIGSRCRIGAGARVADAVLLPGVSVAPGETVAGSVRWNPESFAIRV